MDFGLNLFTVYNFVTLQERFACVWFVKVSSERLYIVALAQFCWKLNKKPF